MNKREQVRKLVDAELDAADHAALTASASHDPELRALLEDAEVLRQHYDALAAHDPIVVPGDLVERSVRRAMLERARAPRRTWLDALTRPRVVRLRVRPLAAAGVLAIAAAALLALAWQWRGAADEGAPAAVARPRMEPPMVAGAEAPPPHAIPVRFVLPAPGARSVSVAGDFNGWRTDVVRLEDDDGDGVFVGSVELPPGSYAYMFVVDGERWVTDPYASNFRDDGFGNRNAVLRLD